MIGLLLLFFAPPPCLADVIWEQVTCGLLHEPMANHGQDASGNGQSQERFVHKAMFSGETVTHEMSSLSQHQCDIKLAGFSFSGLSPLNFQLLQYKLCSD